MDNVVVDYAKMSDVLPIKEATNIISLLDKKYMGYLKDRSFKLDTGSADNGVYVKITLSNKSRDFFYEIEGRLNSSQEMVGTEAAYFLLDYMDAYFAEFFQSDEDVNLPIDWGTFNWDDTELELRGQKRNMKIEAMADALLQQVEDGESTVH